MTARDGPILLYDGVCALCNGVVRFILARDAKAVFRFAALQGNFARTTIARHGRDPAALETVAVVVDPGGATERLLVRSAAIRFALRQLPRPWRWFGAALELVPAALADVIYRIVARTRYRVFGKYDVCPLPAEEHRARFLE